VGTAGTGERKSRVYGADVLRYFAIDTTNNVCLINGNHAVKLPGAGPAADATPSTAGDSLVIVVPRAVASAAAACGGVYDGAYSLDKRTPPMSQADDSGGRCQSRLRRHSVDGGTRRSGSRPRSVARSTGTVTAQLNTEPLWRIRSNGGTRQALLRA
jgi:hypothetical protein